MRNELQHQATQYMLLSDVCSVRSNHPVNVYTSSTLNFLEGPKRGGFGMEKCGGVEGAILAGSLSGELVFVAARTLDKLAPSLPSSGITGRGVVGMARPTIGE